MDQFPVSPDQHSSSDRTRNILFAVLVLVAAFVTLTIISFNRFARYVDEQDEVASSTADVVETIVFDGGDDTVNTDPLVIPEYIGYGGVPSADDKDETVLSVEMWAWSEANPEELCTTLGNYVSSDHVAPYGYPTAAVLGEDDAQTALFDYLGVAEDDRKMAARTLQNVVTPEAQILGVCHGPNTGTFLKAQVGDFAVIYEFVLSDDAPFWVRTYQPVAGVMDGYQFIADNGRGESLIRVGYGDAGYVWWSYYKLDRKYFTAELIEHCSGGPGEGEDGADIDENWSMECDPEYVFS